MIRNAAESVEIQEYIKQHGIKEAVKNFTGLKDGELTDIIVKDYEIIISKNVGQKTRPPAVITVLLSLRHQRFPASLAKE